MQSTLYALFIPACCTTERHAGILFFPIVKVNPGISSFVLGSSHDHCPVCLQFLTVTMEGGAAFDIAHECISSQKAQIAKYHREFDSYLESY